MNLTCRRALHVKFAPRCRWEQKRLLVSSGANVSVECAVDAHPPPTRFSWSLNTSQGVTILKPDAAVRTSGGVSTITRTTPSDLLQEELLCWASNEIGTTSKPCVTQLVAAGEG
ncbi:uncharacterized protein LOC108681502 [Hyalella azteca]|uniref:Uncharacterized protein LOC108681502 n=1 Tax=Hyalella azteca TaxID=294128 RepID=A0A8B7PKS5_HYAAZ|nr:uncharacterized protein LOC108681502 [Hyalella azteca]